MVTCLQFLSLLNSEDIYSQAQPKAMLRSMIGPVNTAILRYNILLKIYLMIPIISLFIFDQLWISKYLINPGWKLL